MLDSTRPQWRRPGVLSMVVLGLAVACGGGPDANDTSDDGNGNGGYPLDTSAYNGLIAWTAGIRFGVYVRDLDANTMLFEREPPEDRLEELPSQPKLSADGSSLAMSLDTAVALSQIGQVHHVDLTTGTVTALPKAIPDSDEERASTHPWPTTDGSTIAYTENRLIYDDPSAEFPTDNTKGDIGLWTVGDAPVLLTTDDAADYRPMLSANGAKVVFVSERDDNDGDFYIMNANPGATPTRLRYDNHADIDDAPNFETPGHVDISDNGSKLVYTAGVTEDATGAFLLDTATGNVERIGTSGDVEYVAISEDGSTLAFVDLQTSETAITYRLLTAAASDPSSTTVGIETSQKNFFGLDLSADGSFVAVGQSDFQGDFPGAFHLVLLRPDGSDITLVASEADELGETFSNTPFYLDVR